MTIYINSPIPGQPYTHVLTSDLHDAVVLGAGVSLDLNGFGVIGPGNELNSIGILSSAAGTSVYGGFVTGFGAGIHLGGANSTVSDMDVSDCVARGIGVAGGNGSITDCTVSNIGTASLPFYGATTGIVMWGDGNESLRNSVSNIQGTFESVGYTFGGTAVLRDSTADGNFTGWSFGVWWGGADPSTLTISNVVLSGPATGIGMGNTGDLSVQDTEITSSWQVSTTTFTDLGGNTLTTGVKDNASVINGTIAADTIAAGDGDNLIEGMGGADLIFSGAGNDVYKFTFDGKLSAAPEFAQGVDKISVAGAAIALQYGTSATGAGPVMVWNAAEHVLLFDADGGGAAAIRQVAYLPYVQTLQSQDFVDWLQADDSATIYGTSGEDLLYAGDGNNTIVGFGGADTIISGLGNDVIVFSPDAVSVAADFQQGADKIYTPYYLATSLQYGSSALGSSAAMLWDHATHRLLYDPDGAGAAAIQQVAYLPTVATLKASDFAGWADPPPAATINDHGLRANAWSQLTGWIVTSGGDAITRYQIVDAGLAADSGYFWTPDNPHHAADTAFEIAASDLASVWLRGGQVGGTETILIRAFDGSDWGGWDTFTLATQANTPPVATINDHSLRIDAWSQLTGWISASDADGDAVTTYEFRDDGSPTGSGYFYTPDNIHHAAGASFTVSASDLANVWLRGGQAGGTETISVRAFDGMDWGAWDTFTLTTQANTLPVATINDHGLRINAWSQLTGWISASDTDGDAITRYQFMDGGSGPGSGYFYTPDDIHHAAGVPFEVATSDLANVWLRGGQSGGSEIIYVRGFDGIDWGTWDTFTLTTQANTPPVATIDDHGLRINEWSQLAGWVARSDADGDPVTMYEFRDDGSPAGSGYFYTPDNIHHAAGAAFAVSASELANVWLRGGQELGLETISVRAFDGTDWGAWDTFTFTTQSNTAPVAEINDHGLHVNEWSQLPGWISYSDAEGDAATRYQFMDAGSGSGSGYFYTPDDIHHAAGVPFEVAASDLANVWLRGGQASGSEIIYVRGFDGYDWGNWDPFTLTTT